MKRENQHQRDGDANNPSNSARHPHVPVAQSEVLDLVSANRLVRFETGSSSEPVLAIQRVVGKAKGRGGTLTTAAIASADGGNTAVVSSERKTLGGNGIRREEQPQEQEAMPRVAHKPVPRRRRKPLPDRTTRRDRGGEQSS